MATIALSHNPLSLNNKFALLEESDHLGDLPTLRSLDVRPKNHNRLNSTDTFKSWSVVDSDEEQGDSDSEDDVYTWSLSTDTHGQDTAELPPPLAIANLDDGFTSISKVMTVQSINGATAVAMASQGSWLIKGKKAKKPMAPGANDAAVPQEQERDHNNDDSDLYDGDLASGMEHQLSKSARAINRRNIRIANARDRRLVEVVGTCTKERMDYKDLREARWHSKAQKSTDTEYATSGITRK